MKKMWRKALLFLRQPRWRHGLPAVLMTAAVLALCVFLNLGMTALENDRGWWKDFSFNGYATTTEETAEALGRMEADVELYLLYQNGEEDTQLYQVLRQYAVLSERVSVKLTDIALNPGILTRFKGDSDTGITADTVIVNCPETGRYRVLGYNDFLSAGYNTETGEYELEGIAYEKKLTEAIVEVTRSNVPAVGILQGHGELETETLSLFTEFLESNGNSVQEVQGLSEEGLSGISMLVIASPVKDFSASETEALAAYAQNGGSFFVMKDFSTDTEHMPNYLSFLKSYGVVPIPGIVVANAEEKGSYYENQIQLLPYMETLDLTLPLISGGMDVLLMPAACAFETPGEATSGLSVGTVLKSGSKAYIRGLQDGETSLEQQPGDRVGECSLALYAHRMHANGNVSRLFICGSSGMFTNEYVYQRTYCQEFLTVLTAELIPSSGVNLDIMASAAVRPGMTVGSGGKALAAIILLPLLIAGIGMAVLLPRKRR